MDNNWKVYYTAKATLPADTDKALYSEMVGYLFGTLKLKWEDLHSMYQHVKQRIIYFKCLREETMRYIIDNFDGSMFKFANGNVARVEMSEECADLKYVRVWGLPPEAPEKDVAEFFQYFGTVRRMVRERYPKELNCPIYTGVRGIFMEIKKDIPHFLYIRNYQIKIHYEGMKEKCYLCGSLDHIRSNCPRKPVSVGSPTFRWNQTENASSNSNMTNLNSLLNKTATTTQASTIPLVTSTTEMATTTTITSSLSTTPITYAATASSSQSATMSTNDNNLIVTDENSNKNNTNSINIQKNISEPSINTIPIPIIQTNTTEDSDVESVSSMDFEHNVDGVDNEVNKQNSFKRPSREKDSFKSSIITRSRSNSSATSVKSSGRGKPKKKKGLPLEVIAKLVREEIK
jgi:hypothetical protein